MQPTIVAVIPAYNEAEAIGQVVRRLRGTPSEHIEITEVIVVDNGSSDRTAAEAALAGARVVSETRRGYGRACLAGLAALKKSDIVLFLDGDGSDAPELWPHLVAPLLEGKADLVIGKRRFDRHASSHPLHARIGTWGIVTLMRILFRTDATDLGPYRAITTAALARLAMQDTGCGWTVEMQTRAAKAGLRIAEVPVPHGKRIAGRSKISGTVSGTLRAAGAMIKVILRERLTPAPTP